MKYRHQNISIFVDIFSTTAKKCREYILSPHLVNVVNLYFQKNNNFLRKKNSLIFLVEIKIFIFL